MSKLNSYHGAQLNDLDTVRKGSHNKKLTPKMFNEIYII